MANVTVKVNFVHPKTKKYYENIYIGDGHSDSKIRKWLESFKLPQGTVYHIQKVERGNRWKPNEKKSKFYESHYINTIGLYGLVDENNYNIIAIKHRDIIDNHK